MNTEFDFAVFIGRFQPFHNGHLKVIEAGLARSERVIIMLGSSWRPRSPRNPWSQTEREQMIRESLTPAQSERVLFSPLIDTPYNDEAWVRNVQASVNGLVAANHASIHKDPRIALLGHSKDHSAYYLRLFPHWSSISVENYREIDATPIRHIYFGDDNKLALGSLREADAIPAGTARFLERFSDTEAAHALRDEVRFVLDYQSAWKDAPYAPTFVTVDAVVIQSGHVLMVERRAQPGKGLIALPGGFVDQQETLETACLRELREETRLKVPAPVLTGSIKANRVYDDPHRSSRGRTITHAFYFELEPQDSLPKVRGGDDARRAFWLPLAELDPQRIFEDHYSIIQDLTGLS